jgi:hypothetical protein
LLRICITAEVDGVRRDYKITYGRYGRKNAGIGFAVTRTDAPGGREADAERLSALIKALTGKEPRDRVLRRTSKGLRALAELADVIARWPEETSR